MYSKQPEYTEECQSCYDKTKEDATKDIFKHESPPLPSSCHLYQGFHYWPFENTKTPKGSSCTLNQAYLALPRPSQKSGTHWFYRQKPMWLSFLFLTFSQQLHLPVHHPLQQLQHLMLGLPKGTVTTLIKWVNVTNKLLIYVTLKCDVPIDAKS